ncbi:elongation factor P [Magnetofaba australis]|uniref:Elongation factor P n=1 Tax=Magnetofaba australis IT-1 TaxID=1434232 RepID=A0A1Y2K5V9_9PROT|nr:elongation factor P [Magnetofaba australis]OSM02494.1 putative translation elongation factor P [Magnetofaba australis IT-1]
MAMLSHNQLKQGTKVLIDDLPWIIVKADFVKPGKGQAFTKIKIKNLMDGRVIDRTFKSSDTVAKAEVMDKEMQYLYNDGEHYHFMDPDTYEQVALSDTQVEEVKDWLKEQETYEVTMWEGQAINVMPPSHMILTITECEPGIKGDTVSGATKPATLETGKVVKVPLFVEEGERIRVDTRTGEYMERAKE